MLRAVQSSRSLSLSAVRQQDLIQQAFVKKIREYAQKGGDLANSDPNVGRSDFMTNQRFYSLSIDF